ncbi:DUF1800 domain-containing protein [Reyranella sp.]|uniref:DUF1800 domain-containing protein n=1 Tax=Reyranella sp. TaxID=1929291 RepID=UPI003BA977CB
MSNDIDAALALSRFGLGAKDGSLSAIQPDPRAALRREITERALAMPAGPDLKSSAELLVELFAYQKAQRLERERKKTEASGDKAKSGPAMAEMAKPEGGMEAGEMTRRRFLRPSMEKPAPGPGTGNKPATGKAMADYKPQLVYLAEVDARFNGTIREPVVGFPERLAMFWANHFAVAVNKGGEVRVTAGAFEREAIRPHLFGRFEDMLLAVESHPAMLAFLDNQQSIGPGSRAGARSKRGLNENLAREILELHTLGVNGGYSQRDVTSLSAIITGWTIARGQQIARGQPLGPPGTFAFNPNTHEPGPQTVLGVSYPDRGVEQGRAALRALASHPATAKHLALKLARHFVADAPPPNLVARLAETFARTRGDLSAIYLALIDSPEAWTPERRKIRSPQEYVVAMLRTSGERPRPQAIVGLLRALGQPLWNPSGPNGYADSVDAWASSEGLATRIDAANLVAASARGHGDPRNLVREALGPLLSPQTDQAMARAEDRKQALSLAFLSPEFQRR